MLTPSSGRLAGGLFRQPHAGQHCCSRRQRCHQVLGGEVVPSVCREDRAVLLLPLLLSGEVEARPPAAVAESLRGQVRRGVCAR